jgi:hypothetical protein
MIKRRGTGLWMQWADVDHSREDAFAAWLDKQRVPRLLRVPGVLSIGRYRATKGGPKHLLMCELEDHDVLKSPAMLDALYTRATGEGERRPDGAHNWLQNGYRQIYPIRIDPAAGAVGMAPFLMVGRMDCPAFLEEQFNAWYNDSYIPTFLTVPGCMRARRFSAIGRRPNYLTVYEMAHAGVQQSDEWTQARIGNPSNARMQAHMQLDEGSPGQYEKVYAIGVHDVQSWKA